MVKKKPQNNFLKSTPKAATDDDSSKGEGNLHRDLQQGRLGAAFIHPQRRIWAPETPANQNPAVSQSADTSVAVTESLDETVAVTESFDADDEQEKDSQQPSSSNDVRVYAGTIPIPTYHNAYGLYTNRYQEGKNPPHSIYKTWREADEERDVRLIDSDNYPESSPEFMRVGPGYPDEDFRPSYNRCETSRHLRFHGFIGDTPNFIRSGTYYRDYPEPDLGPNAVTCIHTCEHECALDNPEFRQAEYERLVDQRDNTPAMLREEPPTFMQMTFRSSDEQAEESMIELNEAFNCEAPIDTPLSESQILEQTTQDLDFNYDSRENLNYTESGETFEEFEAQLVQLLESMKHLSTVNQIFREFFIGDDIDENWPRSLSPTEKIEQYEQCFNKIIQMDWQDIWAEWDLPDPNHFQKMIYRGPDVQRIFRTDKRIRKALSIRP